MKVEFKVTIKWWVKPYLIGVEFFCWLYQCEPNWKKVEETVLKGTSLKLLKSDHKDIF